MTGRVTKHKHVAHHFQSEGLKTKLNSEMAKADEHWY